MSIFTFNRVNREAIWQVLRMCDVGGKLLSGIENIYIDSLACVRVKGGSGLMVLDRSVSCPFAFSMYI